MTLYAQTGSEKNDLEFAVHKLT